jgi:Peptidase propeptide and YPEB domain
VLLFAFFVARGCQEDQVRITQQQAIATAKEQVDFTPENTQIRLLRQGIETRPFWIVSLSVPKDNDQDRFSRLALVHIDANTGKVTEVEEQAVNREQAVDGPRESKQR